MNLAIRGIDNDIGAHHADTFHNDLHKGLKADFILANPPFNQSDWGQERLLDDYRWKFGIPPKGNANYAWIEHMISKLAPSGTAGFVLVNGSMSTSGKDELAIRKELIEQDLVECIVTLSGQLFYSTQIPVCLWFVTKNKGKNGKNERREEVLFIDARDKGHMVSRTLKEFSDEDIQSVANVYHSWRGTNDQQYEDVAGFCKVATTEDIRDTEEVIDIYQTLGLENPNISILSDAFLKDVEGLEQKNVAVELLNRLLKGQVRTLMKMNATASRKFSEMLGRSIQKYNNRTIEASKVIAELIDMAKEIQQEQQRGHDLGLTTEEIAFYDALASHETAKTVMGDIELRAIAHELTKTVKENMSVDWSKRDSAKAKMRVQVRRLLKKYGYPPDLQKMAVEQVVEQAELMASNL